MPRYFFEVNTGQATTIDEAGCDLADLDSVSKKALGILSDIARNRLPAVDRPMVCLVRSEMGTAIYKAKLSLTADWLD